jgi:hypothetical protein
MAMSLTALTSSSMKYLMIVFRAGGPGKDAAGVSIPLLVPRGILRGH